MNTTFRKSFASLFSIFILLSSTFSATLQAQMLTTEDAFIEHDKAQIIEQLSSDQVKQQLLKLGVNSEELDKRINNLSQEELLTLNQQMDNLPAGGSAVGTLVFIFVVLIITDMLGATDVFPFVNNINR